MSGVLTACEGYKLLTLTNNSDRDIRVYLSSNFQQQNEIDDSLIPQPLKRNEHYNLHQDSSVAILTSFGPLWLNRRIAESELSFDYLEIITLDDTIIANSKEAIINLIYSNNTTGLTTKGSNIVNLIFN